MKLNDSIKKLQIYTNNLIKPSKLGGNFVPSNFNNQSLYEKRKNIQPRG